MHTGRPDTTPARLRPADCADAMPAMAPAPRDTVRARPAPNHRPATRGSNTAHSAARAPGRCAPALVDWPADKQILAQDWRDHAGWPAPRYRPWACAVPCLPRSGWERPERADWPAPARHPD